MCVCLNACTLYISKSKIKGFTDFYFIFVENCGSTDQDLKKKFIMKFYCNNNVTRKKVFHSDHNIIVELAIEQKGMTFNHDFGYSFLLFFFPLFQEAKYSKNRDQKTCLSARSNQLSLLNYLHLIFRTCILNFFLVCAQKSQLLCIQFKLTFNLIVQTFQCQNILLKGNF